VSQAAVERTRFNEASWTAVDGLILFAYTAGFRFTSMNF